MQKQCGTDEPLFFPRLISYFSFLPSLLRPLPRPSASWNFLPSFISATAIPSHPIPSPPFPSRSCFSRGTDADAMKKNRRGREVEELFGPRRKLCSAVLPSICPSVSRDSAPHPHPLSASLSGSSSILNPALALSSLVFAAVFNRDQEVLAPVLLVSREEE